MYACRMYSATDVLKYLKIAHESVVGWVCVDKAWFGGLGRTLWGRFGAYRELALEIKWYRWTEDGKL